jgi:hypothetical protein
MFGWSDAHDHARDFRQPFRESTAAESGNECRRRDPDDETGERGRDTDDETIAVCAMRDR